MEERVTEGIHCIKFDIEFPFNMDFINFQENAKFTRTKTLPIKTQIRMATMAIEKKSFYKFV